MIKVFVKSHKRKKWKIFDYLLRQNPFTTNRINDNTDCNRYVDIKRLAFSRKE